MERPSILSVQVGMPRDITFEPSGPSLPGPQIPTWHTAFFKLPVTGSVHVGKTNWDISRSWWSAPNSDE